jgi:zinc/manganese transport system substrate-binding protein
MSHLTRRLPVPRLAITAATVAVLALAVACGGDASTAGGRSGDRPAIVVTTNVLADVVSNLTGDIADVTTILPESANPHDFQASARQVAEMREADALVANGAGFEEGLADAIDAAESDGVPTHEAIDGVDTLDAAGGEHAVDPHFFTDPTRMAVAAQGIADFLAAEVPELDAEPFHSRAAAYIDELTALDRDTEATLRVVPSERRTLVTNHEAFSYFADRYGFEVVGVVIPGGGTGAQPSADELAELAELIEHEGVPAIFADTSSPEDLADALADEVGDVDVVDLYSESLGPDGSGAETYVDMIRTNADRIAGALER